MAAAEHEAEQTGSGVSRRSMDKFFGVEKKPKAAKEISLDGPKKWSQVPSIVDQISNPALYRLAGCETLVFNLDDKEDLKSWNLLQSRCQSDNTNTFILSAEEKWCETKENWKVLVKLQKVEYRDLLSDGRNKHLAPQAVEPEEEESVENN